MAWDLIKHRDIFIFMTYIIIIITISNRICDMGINNGYVMAINSPKESNNPNHGLEGQSFSVHSTKHGPIRVYVMFVWPEMECQVCLYSYICPYMTWVDYARVYTFMNFVETSIGHIFTLHQIYMNFSLILSSAQMCSYIYLSAP
jgi:hypothetical protein